MTVPLRLYFRAGTGGPWVTDHPSTRSLGGSGHVVTKGDTTHVWWPLCSRLKSVVRLLMNENCKIKSINQYVDKIAHFFTYRSCNFGTRYETRYFDFFFFNTVKFPFYYIHNPSIHTGGVEGCYFCHYHDEFSNCRPFIPSSHTHLVFSTVKCFRP